VTAGETSDDMKRAQSGGGRLRNQLASLVRLGDAKGSRSRVASLGRGRSSDVAAYGGDSPDGASTGASGAPVLLSVRRRRAASDSGHETNSSYSGSPQLRRAEEKDASPEPEKELEKKFRSLGWEAGHPDDMSGAESGSSSSLNRRNGLLRLFFHRSAATLLFHHPRGPDLDPSKPYRGVIKMSGSKHGRRREPTATAAKHPPVSATSSVDSSASSAKLDKGNDIPDYGRRSHGVKHAAGAAASERRRSHRTLRQLHREQLQRQEQQQRRSGPIVVEAQLHSSSNSVVSSVESSTCDSGAFSRTSTPDFAARSHTNLLGVDSKSMLALKSPLSAPSLVMEACGMRSRWKMTRYFEEEDDESVNAAHILSCLNAASGPSTMTEGMPDMLAARLCQPYEEGPVSITVGANTMITLGPPSRVGLRRSRSGLPLLGTSGLHYDRPAKNATSSPPKPGRISTSKSGRLLTPSASLREASAPPATSRTSQLRPGCWGETVTVNGRHYGERRVRGHAVGPRSLQHHATASVPKTETADATRSDPCGSLIHV